MRIAVIGGHGHMGLGAVKGLRRLQGAEVLTAGRSPNNDVRFDLSRPDSYDALVGIDVLVDCADTVMAAPDALVEWCLQKNVLLLETAADPAAVRRILDRKDWPDGPGMVVLGAGIFPGMTNLVAAEAVSNVADCDSVEVGVRWSPFSAGGKGMVNLVPHLLGVPTHKVSHGQLVVGPSVEKGPKLPFAEGSRSTLHVAFTEPDLLARSHSLREIATYGSFVPDILMTAFSLTPLWLLRLRIARAWLWLQFTLIRRVFLRNVPAGVRIVARARNAKQEESVVTFECNDGIEMGGRVIAAMVEILAENRPPGIHVPDALMSADAVRRRLDV